MNRKSPCRHKVTRNGKTFWRGKGTPSKKWSHGKAGKSYEDVAAKSAEIPLSEYHLLPKKVQNIVAQLEEGGSYKSLAAADKKLSKHGYELIYGLDGASGVKKKRKSGNSKDQEFNKWMNSDNVVKKGRRYYTQDSQYRKGFTKTELRKYFKHEFS